MSAESPSGRVIDGRFTLVERLGSGGMGMVWRARDMALHRDVALKEVRPPDPNLAEYDPEGARTLRARVLREARALARLDHPNVVTVHHIVDPGEDGYPWIVMELVAGSSLHDRLAAGPVEPAEAAELGRGVLSALRAAHASGIHHRDVKPANVLLRTDGRPVLTDFGIAAIRESTSLTATGALIGSPDYIAPERIRGTEGDPSSDLWSLGMMLYVAVEGRHPLRRATTLATLAAVLDEEIPPPVRAGALAPVLGALLTRDIAARPDAETLDALLAEAARTGSGDGSPARAPGPTPTEPVCDRPAPSGPGGPEGRVPTAYGFPPTPAPVPNNPPAPVPNNPYRPGNPYQQSYAAAVPVLTEEERRRRSRRRTRMAATASSVVSALVLAGVVLWTSDVLPFGRSGSDGGDRPRDTAGAPADGSKETPPASNPTPEGVADDEGDDDDRQGGEEPETPENLLTPDGARAAIKALKPLMGGTKVTDFTLHGEHASAEAPLESNSRLYDRFSYRDGQAKNDELGGTLTSGETTVDLNSVDWDALPALLRTAGRTLNIPEPESRYVIVDPSSPFHDDRPVLRVYVTDSHGGAFLTAHLDGRVIEKSPRPKG
ncbi:serine/threonine-protein kinase [Streptomyces sp. C11-1]|uniref:non-specific serine/threonine protein kinase n=1 Tax=Streptomyces durocortorensis TaxID=2811104 RepID=A0ABY9W3B5_9ACTN|nr:serine/threonine-protein kinase [Streptomyces durocortorensis]WNF29571.1 serine/threonine-protein kinase [Streptomyces durocortorensis]